MDYIVIILSGLFFAITASVFINLYEVTKYNLTDSITLKWALVPVSSKRIAFNILGAIAIILIGIEMRYMFSDNTIVHQIKLQFLLAVLMALTFIDYRYRIVPNVVLLFCLVIRVFFLIAEFVFERNIFWNTLKDLGLGVLVFSLFMVICMLITKSSIGMGDLKLFIIIALFQGLTYALTSIFFSLLLCFVISIVLLILKKKKVKDSLPMVPCILIGTYISIALTGM